MLANRVRMGVMQKSNSGVDGNIIEFGEVIYETGMNNAAYHSIHLDLYQWLDLSPITINFTDDNSNLIGIALGAIFEIKPNEFALQEISHLWNVSNGWYNEAPNGNLTTSTINDVISHIGIFESYGITGNAKLILLLESTTRVSNINVILSSGSGEVLGEFAVKEEYI